MYNHKQVEEEILKFWEKKKIFEKVKKAREKGEPYYFCDGPPYATGQIHPGTAWNKAIKDTVCRYWTSQGYNVRTQPGYDTHGLPIEVKVEKEMNIKNKHEIEEIGIEKFINECKKFATKYIGVMNGQFKSIGVWMNYENPYITYYDNYIESSWKTLKQAWDKGLMHEGDYVLPYCYRCETTMANYELEYWDETDPSIYVKFKVKEKENEYLVIWTTTPWTLVANLAVMVHPTLPYVKVQVDDEVWVVAKDLMEKVLNLVGKSGVVLEELSGKKLEGTQYEHPFQDKIKKEYERKVVLSDEYVTLEEGTGLVHTAPGHGEADFIIGKRFGIEPFSPVNEKGEYTEEAGDFEGKNVKEANPEIMELLENRGILVYSDRIRHRYPHCWRCKTPLIFRATHQWFITVSKVKDKMLSEINTVEWYPSFVKKRFTDFVTVAPDWCISRQRYWGIPLPIWKCECGEIKVIGNRDELPKVKELHRPFVDKITFKCEKCGKEMHRIKDVLDVWFDSGNAVWASLTEEEVNKFGERADFIVEGQDQIRGWFYSLLGSGIVRYDKCPYKRLMMHGFFVDEKGEKMSKSLGNFVPLEEILEKYGADSFRLWGLNNAVWEELKFNWTELKEAHGDLMVLYNMYVFLERFIEKKPKKPKKIEKEDEWMLSRLNRTLKSFHEAFKNYEINKGIKEIRSFLVNDLSRWYMKIAKDRISSGENKEAALWTIYTAMLKTIKMLGIITPMTAEYVYQNYYSKFEKEESLFMHELEKEDEIEIKTPLENKMGIVKEICSNGFTARQKAGIKTRWPIRNVYIETTSQEAKEGVNELSHIIKKQLNCKDVHVVDKKPEAGKIEECEFGLGKIHLDIHIDEELYEEGIANEIKRRIQNMRKQMKLVEKDMIEIKVGGEEEFMKIIEKYSSWLEKAVNAKSIKIEKNLPKGETYMIDGREITLEAKKI